MMIMMMMMVGIVIMFHVVDGEDDVGNGLM